MNQTDYRLLTALTSDSPGSDGRRRYCTTDRQLSARLGYSIRSVNNRVGRLLQETGSRNRVALAVWWLAQADAEVERWRVGVQWRPGEKKQRTIDRQPFL